MSGLDNTSYTYRNVTAAATVSANDFHVHATAGTAYAITLPDSESIQPGRPYFITKDAGANAITITPFDAGDTINGATTLVLAASAFHGAQLVNTGDVWIAVSLY